MIDPNHGDIGGIKKKTGFTTFWGNIHDIWAIEDAPPKSEKIRLLSSFPITIKYHNPKWSYQSGSNWTGSSIVGGFHTQIPTGVLIVVFRASPNMEPFRIIPMSSPTRVRICAAPLENDGSSGGFLHHGNPIVKPWVSIPHDGSVSIWNHR